MPTDETTTTRLLNELQATLDPTSERVARHIAQRTSITRALVQEAPEQPMTYGQRAADAVARFGGSWTFIGIFMTILVVWVVLNSALLVRSHEVFDPYPYILLNLFLSMLAAIQAPIILMSQNRQAEKDRGDAAHDYEVNLKSELEIMLLHDKMDQLREQQWTTLLEIQQEQLRILGKLIDARHEGSTNV
jgi:uncharacterized membrane protein